MTPQIKWIWFDADNTLWEYDKNKAYKKMFMYISKKYNLNIKIVEKEYWNIIRNVSKSLNPEVRKRNYSLNLLLKKFNINFSESDVEEIVCVFTKELVTTIKPIDGIKEFLSYFKNKINFGIFSEEFRDFLLKKLDSFDKNWKYLFKFLVTPEITGVMKPSIKYYEKILEVSNVCSREIMIIGDSWEKDLKIAKDLEMKTVLVNSKKEKIGNPDYVIRNYYELLEILQ